MQSLEKRTLRARKQQASLVLRRCVPMCLRLSEEGERSLGKGQHIGVGSTHILQGPCNDITFKRTALTVVQ